MKQNPRRVAEALSLCEAACSALHHQLSSEEIQHHVQKEKKLQQRLETALTEKEDQVHKLKHELNHKVQVMRQELEAEHKQHLATSLQQHQNRYDRHVESTKATHANLTQEIEILKDTLKQTEATKTQLLRDMQTQIQQETERIKETIKQKYQDELADAKEKADQLKLRVGDVRETLRQQADVERLASQQRIDSLQEELAHNRAQLQKTIEDKDQYYKEHHKQMKEMCDDHRTFMSTLSGSQVKGDIGERFVDEVFGEMELGTLTDVSRKQTEGFADRTWQYDPGVELPPIRGIIEAKYKKQLHSKNDIEKFYRDVKSGVDQNRINCAIMLSLSSRIQGNKGSRQLHLHMVHGIPVLEASRSANDSLSPMALVKMAFITLVNVWPHLASNESRNEDQIIHSVSTHLEKQLDRINELQKQIDYLETTGAGLQKQASALKKTKDAMWNEIDSLKQFHPQLIKISCHKNGDKIDSMHALIEAVGKRRTEKNRYPEKLADLDAYLDDSVRQHITQQMFEDAKETVKRNYKPGKKRTREESTTEPTLPNKNNDHD